MIWSDRIALVFAVLCGGVIAINTDPARAFQISLVLVLLLWFLLRAADFIVTGRIRRR